MSDIENYGGTFHNAESENVGFGRITLWHDVEETYPGGAYLAPSETYPVGTVIPGGTPVTIKDGVPGGAATLNDATPTGLSKDDRTVGSDGCDSYCRDPWHHVRQTHPCHNLRRAEGSPSECRCQSY